MKEEESESSDNGFVLVHRVDEDKTSLRGQHGKDVDMPETFLLGSFASSFTNVDDENNKHVVEMASDTSRRHRVYDPTNDLGLLSAKPIIFLVLWYFFSAVVVFLNKHIVGNLRGQESLLSCSQMVFTMLGGFVQLHHPLGMFEVSRTRRFPEGFKKYMMIVGCLRFTTVLTGLLALDYLEVSFVETVKSTAPAFTLVISSLLLGEETGIYVKCSLIPVMGGLALCSANELSFNYVGFVAALATNVSECLQFVYSKMLISSSTGGHTYTPAEVQYYTSKFSLVLQVPCLMLMLNWNELLEFVHQTDAKRLTGVGLLYSFNGISYHFQTMCAYALMDFVSPITHSVANTAKRALIIWLSVLTFGNPVTFLSGTGTVIVIVGVLLYNRARDVDARRRKKKVGSYGEEEKVCRGSFSV